VNAEPDGRPRPGPPDASAQGTRTPEEARARFLQCAQNPVTAPSAGGPLSLRSRTGPCEARTAAVTRAASSGGNVGTSSLTISVG